VFCDGLRYHVCPDKDESRLADDIGKRRALLESGQFRVWSITWKDLDEGAGVTTLLTRVQRELYLQFFDKDPQAQWMRDDERKSRSSFKLLWEYLEHPDAAVWAAMAKRFAASMLQVNPPWSAESVHAEREALRTSVKREPSRLIEANRAEGAPKRWAGLDARGNAVLLSELPLTAVQKGKFEEGELTLRLYDDAASRREAAFEESWRAFLHAWNVLQFHARLPEVVSTELLRQESGEAPSPSVRRPSTMPPAAGAPADDLDAYARLARDFSDAADMLALAEALRAGQLPVPVDAGSLDLPVELEALLAWPAQRLVLVQAATATDLASWAAAGRRPARC